MDNWKQIRNVLGDDLSFHLVFDAFGKLEDRFHVRLSEAENSPYESSLCYFWLRREIQDQIEKALKTELAIEDSRRWVEQALDFMYETIENREPYEMAVYTDYLESWIQSGASWNSERPIPFEAFEFISGPSGKQDQPAGDQQAGK